MLDILNKVCVFELIAGQLVIGKVTSYAAESFTVSKPARIVVMQSEVPGKTNVALVPIPLSTFSDGESYKFLFNACSILPVEASAQVKNQYNVQYGSNLVIPEQSKLII